MTYIASYFHAFSSMGGSPYFPLYVFFNSKFWLADQAETVSRRVEKFADLMQSVWVSRNDYERRVKVVRQIPSCRTRGSKLSPSYLNPCAPKYYHGVLHHLMAHTSLRKHSLFLSTSTNRQRRGIGSQNDRIWYRSLVGGFTFGHSMSLSSQLIHFREYTDEIEDLWAQTMDTLTRV
jgi:hypothetical protein